MLTTSGPYSLPRKMQPSESPALSGAEGNALDYISGSRQQSAAVAGGANGASCMGSTQEMLFRFYQLVFLLLSSHFLAELHDLLWTTAYV